jgi:hypothetical protein
VSDNPAPYNRAVRIGNITLIFADPVQSIPTLLSDINMLVIAGGMERTDNCDVFMFAAAAGVDLFGGRNA